VVFEDEARGESHTYRYEEGIRAYLAKLLAERGQQPIGGDLFYAERLQGEERGGLPELECVVAWTEATDEAFLSFVNSIPTTSGGTHENGLKSALVKAVRNYLEIHNLVPRGVTIAPEDVREGVAAILSCYLTAPQFQGQTKERLNNPETQSMVDGAVRTALE